MRRARGAGLGPWAVIAAAAALGACSDDGADRVCDPGAMQVCACTSGATGAQVCDQEGQVWLPCVCSGGDSGPRADHGAGDGRADLAGDGPGPDSGVDGPAGDSAGDLVGDGPVADTGGSDGSQAEAGGDTGQPDAVDGAQPDAVDGAQPDAVDSGVDGPAGDLGPSDGGPSGPRVIYKANKSSYGPIYEVGLDGAGKRPVPGLPSTVYIQRTALRTPHQETLGVGARNDRPSVRHAGPSDHIRLPGALGWLFNWTDGAQQGLLIVRPDGAVELLDLRYAIPNGSHEYVEVAPDGALAAVAHDTNRVSLVRLDGSAWGGSGSDTRDVSPAGALLAEVDAGSLLMSATRLYFVAEDALSGARELYAAPLDGSAAAEKVAGLPAVGGQAVNEVRPYGARSGDRSTVAFVACHLTPPETRVCDVVTIADGGAPAKATSLADDLSYVGDFGFLTSGGATLALSQSGQWLAFAAGAKASAENRYRSWIVPASGVGSAVELSAAGFFAAEVRSFGGFFWPDDANLLFWAGSWQEDVDLFRYQLGGALTNLTQTSSAGGAPWSSGTLTGLGGWVAPDAGHVYYVAGEIWAEVLAVSLSGFGVTHATPGVSLVPANFKHVTPRDWSRVLGSVAGDSRLWLVGIPTAAPATRELYVFDGATAGGLAPLTSLGLSLDTPRPAPDGQRVAFRASTASTSALRVVPAQGGAAPLTLVSGAPGKLGPPHWSADSGQIVFTASGLLVKVPAAGGAVEPLDPVAGQDLYVLAVGGP